MAHRVGPAFKEYQTDTVNNTADPAAKEHQTDTANNTADPAAREYAMSPVQGSSTAFYVASSAVLCEGLQRQRGNPELMLHLQGPRPERQPLTPEEWVGPEMDQPPG